MARQLIPLRRPCSPSLRFEPIAARTAGVERTDYGPNRAAFASAAGSGQPEAILQRAQEAPRGQECARYGAPQGIVVFADCGGIVEAGAADVVTP